MRRREILAVQAWEPDVKGCGIVGPGPLAEGREKKTASSKCLSLEGLFALFNLFGQQAFEHHMRRQDTSTWLLNELL